MSWDHWPIMLSRRCPATAPLNDHGALHCNLDCDPPHVWHEDDGWDGPIPWRTRAPAVPGNDVA